MGRIELDGKHFSCGGERFAFRGVTYGTFRPRADGARFPERAQVKTDFAAMRDAGFTVVRTYTAPPDDVVTLAADWGLRLLAGVFYPDWRYLLGASRGECRRVAGLARDTVAAEAARLAGREEVLALAVGNEVPADVLRWVGTRHVARRLDELADVVRDHDPGMLVTYPNFPTAEYLPLDGFDFVTFNVFLEDQRDFRRYLTRLHNLAGDRPVVLGEIGLHAPEGSDGEEEQAASLHWQLETAVERGVAGTCVFSWTDEWWVGDNPVEGWRFGLTRADRSPRPSLDVAAAWNRRTVADVKEAWPSISVVVCAYNAEATVDECLSHACALDYPGLEVVVVDDGSTDATAELVGRHPRARLVRVPHSGLAAARNAGWEVARGKLVAYLDSDAYPTPEWPYYLALGLDSPTVGGVGGPNVPPRDAPPGAHRVALAPGGPVHVLTADDRAEHLPGCNMAFYRDVLAEVGGFDAVYTAAGDDVDLCWKVLDHGWQIAFHPAALVWHHRRPRSRAYFRQQRGYGRAEALVEAHHPHRFTPLGTARWRGRIYNSLMPPHTRQRVYRGEFGAAAYQSVYQGGGHALDLAHQLGVPAAVPALASAPLAVLHSALALPALAGLAGLLGLVTVDVARARLPRAHTRRGPVRSLGFRLAVAGLCLGQPLVRSWGRLRHGMEARRAAPVNGHLAGPAREVRRVLVLPADRPREEIAADVLSTLRRAGMRAVHPTGWEDHDGLVIGSAFVAGALVTSAYPEGCVQLRMRPRLRRGPVVLALAGCGLAALVAPGVAVAGAALVAAEVARGLWRVTYGARRYVCAAAQPLPRCAAASGEPEHAAALDRQERAVASGEQETGAS